MTVATLVSPTFNADDQLEAAVDAQADLIRATYDLEAMRSALIESGWSDKKLRKKFDTQIEIIGNLSAKSNEKMRSVEGRITEMAVRKIES